MITRKNQPSKTLAIICFLDHATSIGSENWLVRSVPAFFVDLFSFKQTHCFRVIPSMYLSAETCTILRFSSQLLSSWTGFQPACVPECVQKLAKSLRCSVIFPEKPDQAPSVKPGRMRFKSRRNTPYPVNESTPDSLVIPYHLR